MTHQSTPHSRRHATGFSLVELMISMALALILLLGVNYVFRSTQQTVSTGMALSSQVRIQHAASDSIRNDFLSAVSADRQPSLVIHSYSVLAYRDRNDQQTDKDGKVETADINASGNDLAGVPNTSPNFRYHRVDTLSFFASGKFRRQTGQPAPGSQVLVSDMTSKEAWIWYGHAALPDKTNNYRGPGEPGPVSSDPNTAPYVTNPLDYANAYASKWVLGRVAILLEEPDSSTPGKIYDSNGTNQVFLWNNTAVAPTDQLWPLAYNAVSAKDTSDTAGTVLIQSSGYDLAGTSISGFTDKVTTAQASTPNWWWGLVYPPPVGGAITPARYRFNVDPYPLQPPITPLAMARTTPALVSGCTQFIVEFAGDFVTQDSAGNVIAPAVPSKPGDGIIDYVVTNTTTNERQVRWYGAQRDIARGAASGTYAAAPDGAIDPLVDVVPISLVPGYASNATSYKYDLANGGFEKELVGPPYRYTCAWGPKDTIKPKMIRVTLETTDPQGRLPEPRVEQYVMTLK